MMEEQEAVTHWQMRTCQAHELEMFTANGWEMIEHFEGQNPKAPGPCLDYREPCAGIATVFLLRRPVEAFHLERQMQRLKDDCQQARAKAASLTDQCEKMEAAARVARAGFERALADMKAQLGRAGEMEGLIADARIHFGRAAWSEFEKSRK